MGEFEGDYLNEHQPHQPYFASEMGIPSKPWFGGDTFKNEIIKLIPKKPVPQAAFELRKPSLCRPYPLFLKNCPKLWVFTP